jgi:hypothetical protein
MAYSSFNGYLLLYITSLTHTLLFLAQTNVLAAAILSGADTIVTFNLKDFPEEALKPYGIKAQHPDEFLNCQLDLAPNVVCAAAKKQRGSLKNPPMNVEEYLASLERQGLAQTVSSLREYAELI